MIKSESPSHHPPFLSKRQSMRLGCPSHVIKPKRFFLRWVKHLAKFYVYELREPDGNVFYVGKGTNNRAYVHEYRAQGTFASRCLDRIRQVWARGLNIDVVFVFWSDDEKAAHAEERRLIVHYGRPALTNRTNGGQGFCDMPERNKKISAALTGKKLSEETKSKLRAANLGKRHTPETIKKMVAVHIGIRKGVPLGKHTEEFKRNVSLRHTGKVNSVETRRKMIVAQNARYNRGFDHVQTQAALAELYSVGRQPEFSFKEAV